MKHEYTNNNKNRNINANEEYYYSSGNQTEDGSFSSQLSNNEFCKTTDGILFIRDRKKRRGVIEKRRRDRINACLGELKRLVPQAIEKESSTKLEKAEILQLTVEYLKDLEIGNLNYKAMGFRDCISEMSHFLVNVEQLSPKNELLLRLETHLKCFAEKDYYSKVFKDSSCSINDGKSQQSTSSPSSTASSIVSSNQVKAHKVSSKKNDGLTENLQQKKPSQMMQTQTKQSDGTPYLNNSAFLQINITANGGPTPNYNVDQSSHLWPTNTNYTATPYNLLSINNDTNAFQMQQTTFNTQSMNCTNDMLFHQTYDSTTKYLNTTQFASTPNFNHQWNTSLPSSLPINTTNNKQNQNICQ